MLSVVCSRSAQRIASLRQIDSCLFALSNVRFFAIDRRRKGHDSPGRSRKNSLKERDRGNSRLGPSSTGGEESNITGMKEMIDRIDQGMEIPLKGNSKGKLAKALTKPEKAALSVADQGSMDTLSEEICDVINQAFDSSSFMFTFPGVAKTSDVIEIEYCTSNPDISHVTAYWRSDVVDAVISELMKRKELEKIANIGIPPSKNLNNDKFDAIAVLAKAEKKIKKSLQLKEGQIRSYLSRHMEFRRVPRLFFELSDAAGRRREILGEVDYSNNTLYEKQGVQFIKEEVVMHMAENRVVNGDV